MLSEPDFTVKEESTTDERRFVVTGDFGGKYAGTATIILQSTSRGGHNTFYDKHVSRASEDDPKKAYLLRMCATDTDFFNADLMDEADTLGIVPTESGVPASTMICLSVINEKQMAYDMAICLVRAFREGVFDRKNKNRKVTLVFSTPNCVAEVRGDTPANLTVDRYSTINVQGQMHAQSDAPEQYTFSINHCDKR